MQRKTMTSIGVGVAAAGLTFGLIAAAQADDQTTATAQPSQAGTVQAADDTTAADDQNGGRGGAGETALTGTDAEQATAAAQAAVPDGTVLRVETDSDGTYEAHVEKSDGTQVVVKMDESFAVTSVDEFTGRGPGGHGGAGETALTGTDAEQATAAAQAAVPDGTVLRVETDSDGTYEAHVEKSDGTHVVVKMDESFAVTSVDAFTGRGPGGHGGAGETALTGTGAEQATAAAQAAVPDGTVLRVETDSDGTYEAHVEKSDGTHVVVKMDESFAVTSVDEFTGRGPGGPGGRGGHHGPADSTDDSTDDSTSSDSDSTTSSSSYES